MKTFYPGDQLMTSCKNQYHIAIGEITEIKKEGDKYKLAIYCHKKTILFHINKSDVFITRNNSSYDFYLDHDRELGLIDPKDYRRDVYKSLVRTNWKLVEFKEEDISENSITLSYREKLESIRENEWK